MNPFTDPACYADILVGSLSLYFGPGRLPSTLGREAYGVIGNRLRAWGFFEPYHIEEALAIALNNAANFLSRHGTGEIREPRAWVFALCRHACDDYKKRAAESSLRAS
jgi:hypothetical protein